VPTPNRARVQGPSRAGRNTTLTPWTLACTVPTPTASAGPDILQRECSDRELRARAGALLAQIQSVFPTRKRAQPTCQRPQIVVAIGQPFLHQCAKSQGRIVKVAPKKARTSTKSQALRPPTRPFRASWSTTKPGQCRRIQQQRRPYPDVFGRGARGIKQQDTVIRTSGRPASIALFPHRMADVEPKQ
jgi:hypothetical protein